MNLIQRYEKEIEKMMIQSTSHHNREITPENVFQEANRVNRGFMRKIVAELMLEGSGIEGQDNLRELAALAAEGKRCLLLPAHLSNMDVPALWYLMEQSGPQIAEIFEKIVFVAGRKLNEDNQVMKMLSEMFTRLVITPRTFYEGMEEGPELDRLLKEGQAINLAAHRVVRLMSAEGRIFLVYPSGTRLRPWDSSTGRGRREVESYLRVFDYFCIGATKGNLLPPQQTEMHVECPEESRVVMRFGEVLSTKAFRKQCADEAAKLEANGRPVEDLKQYTIDRVMEMIEALTKKIILPEE